MGGRVDMSRVRDGYARPIRFKDILPGDILMDETIHVMLFKEWVDYDPSTDGDPVPNDTQFRVYEASLGAGKVIESTYAFQKPDPNTDINVSVWWEQSKRMEDSSKIEIDGHIYVPRQLIDLAPIDVVLVIDKSGSMQGEKIEAAKEAAKQFVFQMRDKDKIGVVGL